VYDDKVATYFAWLQLRLTYRIWYWSVGLLFCIIGLTPHASKEALVRCVFHFLQTKLAK